MEDLQILVERCENRTSYLGNKVTEVNKSLKAVKESCSSARLALDLNYERIKMEVVRALDDRYHSLVDVIEKSKKEDMDLLKNLEDQLNTELSHLQELTNKGNAEINKNSQVFENGESEDSLDESASVCKEIASALEKTGKSSPDMPCASLSIVVGFDESKAKSSIENLRGCIAVDVIGGLQITECVEMPGGILIRWDEHSTDSESVDTDNSVVTDYILQCASCASKKPNHSDHDESSLIFNTLYTGEEMQYFLTDIDAHSCFYFRVCKKLGEEFGPWSLIKKGWTTLPPHEWNLEDCANEGSLPAYELGNNNRTATKVFPESCKILRSLGTTCRLGHAINFKMDEVGERSSKDGIALVTKRFDKDSGELLIFSPESIVVNTKGAIYVNGTVMVMMLPNLKRGSVLSFQTTRVSQEKLRVSISNEDKEVTFDWLAGHVDNELAFAASFEHTGWQITVY
ncbi:cytokine receptor-like factor 3 isoform X1 [Rhopilema esculentum]|uniref:cytokine receptor-like factor 3 isoform X1 n=1 Tax=Rhopilema esculentum TaxID=499914 RepID=UPI0031E1C87D